MFEPAFGCTQHLKASQNTQHRGITYVNLSALQIQLCYRGIEVNCEVDIKLNVRVIDHQNQDHQHYQQYQQHHQHQPRHKQSAPCTTCNHVSNPQ